MTRQLSVGGAVTVAVPATSANLGPGFDCFGLALDWRERVRVRTIESGFRIDVTGEGAADLPRDESHLVIRSTLIGLADLGVEAPGLWLGSRNTIPHGRGLGSSSAAIVAGLLAAVGLAGVEPDRDWLLRHATAIEGHPDNVAAAIFGGFALAYEGRSGVAVATPPVHPEIEVVALVPATEVATKAARGLLPDVVPHVDAAANAGRAALLVHALTSDPTLLYEATRDWLHQGYRQPAMPRTYELLMRLRGRGLAAVVSGAGPSLLVLGTAAQLADLRTADVPGFDLVRSGIGNGAGIDSVESATP